MNPSLAIQIVLMIAVFYFLLIRPQQQRAKKEAMSRIRKALTEAEIH